MDGIKLIANATGLVILFIWVFFFIRAFVMKKSLPWGFLIVIAGMVFSGHGIDIAVKYFVVHIDMLFITMMIGVLWDINHIRRLVSRTDHTLARIIIGCALGLVFGAVMSVFDGEKYIQLHQQYTLISLITLSIQISLAEELWFRGFFLGYLQDNQFKEISANLIQSILFTLLHIPRYSDNWMAVIVIFLSGYLAGFYTIRDKSLMTAFFMHITINIVAIVWWLIKM